MTDKQKAVDLLREFANHRGGGIRGVVRMLVLRTKAQELLARIDRKQASKKPNE